MDYHFGCVIFSTAKICEITKFPIKMKEPVSGMLYFKLVCKYGLFKTGKWNIVVQHIKTKNRQFWFLFFKNNLISVFNLFAKSGY